MENRSATDQDVPVIAMVIFATLTAYMLFAAAFCFIYAANSGDSDMTFIIFSLIATYGCYVFSSLLALDPWHLSESAFNGFEQQSKLTWLCSHFDASVSVDASYLH